MIDAKQKRVEADSRQPAARDFFWPQLWSAARSSLFLITLLISFGAGFVPLSHAQSAAAPLWTLLGPTTLPARAVALAEDPRTDSVIYLVAPGGGLWKSTDGGQTWSATMDSTYSTQACSIAIDPNSPDLLYVGTGDDQSPRPTQGVARSPDGGQTWAAGVRFSSHPVCAVAVDPANSTHVLAGSSDGLFLSTNSAASWRKVLTLPVTAIAFDGNGGIYAGQIGSATRENLLARSTDGGSTWTNLALPLPPNPAALQPNWVAVLARGSAVWVAVASPAPGSADSSVDFYRSTDSGNTWVVTGAIGSALPPMQMALDPAGKNLYLTGSSALVSTDQGATWSTVQTGKDHFHSAVFTHGSILLAGEKGLDSLPLAQSQSGEALSSLPVGQFLALALDSVTHTFAGGMGGLSALLSPSSPIDSAWQASISGTTVGSVVTPTTGTPNLLAGSNLSVYQSADEGQTFSISTVVPAGEARAPSPPLVLDPTNSATAYTAGQKLYRTTNSGTSWSAVTGTNIDPDPTHVVVAMAIAPGARRTLYAATACIPQANVTTPCLSTSSIWRSTNGGTSWTAMSVVAGLINHLAVDPRLTGTVYAAVGAFPGGGPSASAGYSPGDLLRSTDNGTTWTSLRENMPAVPINSIVIDPASVPTTTNTVIAAAPGTPGAGGFGGGGLGPGATGAAGGAGGIFVLLPGQNALQQPAQILYAATDAGVFASFNAGSQWTGISSGLPPVPVTQLLLQGTNLLAATFGRGVYQTSTTFLKAGPILNPLSLKVSLAQDASTSAGISLTNVAASSITWQAAALDSWLSVSQAGGTVLTGTVSSVPLQISAAGLSAGTYLGRVRISSNSGFQDILITLQVTAAPAAITISGSNNATGTLGTTVPLTVSVADANGSFLPGVQVNFAIASGGGSLGSRTATSDASGTASTLLTLPSSPGKVQVIASAGAASVTFSISAVQAILPSLMANSVVNGVSFNSATPPSPGSIISIFGQNLASSYQNATSFPLQTQMAGTSVTLIGPAGNILLPLFYVSPLQVNALIPYSVPAGGYSLRVDSVSGASNVVSLVVAAFSPGIFTVTSNGQGSGIFIQPDSSLVSAGNPALAGSMITLYATGLGAVNPPLDASLPGAAAEPLNRTIQTPRVFFDQFEGQIQYSGLAPGYAGLYQINVRVPASVASASNMPVTLSIGGITSNRVTIAVQAAPAQAASVPPPSGATGTTPPTTGGGTGSSGGSGVTITPTQPPGGTGTVVPPPVFTPGQPPPGGRGTGTAPSP